MNQDFIKFKIDLGKEIFKLGQNPEKKIEAERLSKLLNEINEQSLNNSDVSLKITTIEGGVIEINRNVNDVKNHLKIIDGVIIERANEFYKSINDEEIKNSLIQEFIEMEMALKKNDLFEFGLRVIKQIEGMLNLSLRNMDFFKIAKADSAIKELEIRIPDIHEYTRIQFVDKQKIVKKKFNFHYDYSVSSDLYFIRNKEGHLDKLTEEEKKRIIKMNINITRTFFDFITILNNFNQGINNIHN